jgi:hypothetical protein
MCARVECNRVIGPQSFVVAYGAALYCTQGCATSQRSASAQQDVH